MAALPQQPTVLSFEEARHVVEQHAAGVHPDKVETETLLASVGRVLAKPIAADRDFPPFRRAMRDGYAVHSSDLRHLPATLDVIAEIKAGAAPEELPAQVRLGQAAAIMTGAPTPAGADAVVMVEYTSQTGNRVTITRAVASGDNVVPVGSEARQGDVLLRGAPGSITARLRSQLRLGKTPSRYFCGRRLRSSPRGMRLWTSASSPVRTRFAIPIATHWPHR